MRTHIKNGIVRGYDLNLIAVVGISTLALVLRRYYPLDIDFPRATQLIYYLLVPLAAGWVLFRDKPWDYGIRIGQWKPAMMLTAASVGAMALILYGIGRMPEFRSYYPMYDVDWPELLLSYTRYIFAWGNFFPWIYVV